MLNNRIDINGCSHYLVKEEKFANYYHLLSRFIEPDLDLLHPLGKVYKPAGVIDTPIRLVIQPDNSVLYFNIYDWHNIMNPFVPENRKYKFLQRLFSIFTKPKDQPMLRPYVLLSLWQD